MKSSTPHVQPRLTAQPARVEEATSTVQYWGWISGMLRRAASGALALMILLQVALTAPPSAKAQAFTYKVLYTFAGGADGGVPAARLARDSAGNLYGTTEYLGTSDWGVVFNLDASDKESVLHSFTGGADGATSARAWSRLGRQPLRYGFTRWASVRTLHLRRRLQD